MIQEFGALTAFLSTLGYDFIHKFTNVDHSICRQNAKVLAEKIFNLCGGEEEFVITYCYPDQFLLLHKRK